MAVCADGRHRFRAGPSGPASLSLRFADFYRHHFEAEHRRPANIALHVAGTLAGAAWLPASFAAGQPWLALLYPLVHAAPGLLGHRLFERNAAVGDVRVLRRDFLPLWFIAASHVLTWRLLRRIAGGAH